MRDRWRTARLVLSTAVRVDRLGTAAVIGLTLANFLSTTAVAYLFKLLGDFAADGRVTAALGVGIALGLLHGTVNNWTGWKAFALRLTLEEKTLAALDQQLMEMHGRIPDIEHCESPEHLDRMALFQAERGTFGQALGVIVFSIGLASRVLVTVCLLTFLHPALLTLPLFAIPALLLTRRAQRLVRETQNSTAADMRRLQHLFDVGTTADAGKELRLYGATTGLMRRFDRTWRESERRLGGADIKSTALEALGAGAFAIGYAGAIVFMANRVASGTATPGDLLMAITLCMQVNRQVVLTVSSVSSLLTVLRAGGRYRELVEYATERSDVGTGAPPPERIEHAIELHDVSFRYPGTDVWALRNVNLRIPAGSVVAVVGENGAGKSTLVKLLYRFYEPTEGRITVDGRDLRDFDVTGWRTRLSATFQDFLCPEVILRDAVALGDLTRGGDGDALHTALRRAGADGLVDTLPAGLETQLGRMFDGGIDLSGGQWQRTALARGLMRETPMLLALDEPTASLDAEMEAEIVRRELDAATATDHAQRVSVIVSHRLASVRDANLIVVLDGGGVAEAGSHGELMCRGGLYAELYDLHAQGYR